MGRIYQALAHSRTASSELITPLKVLDESVDDPFLDDEAPYIEVGGPVATGSMLTTKKPGKAKRTFGIAFRAVPTISSKLAPASSRLIDELIAFHDPAHEISAEYRFLGVEIAAQLAGMSSRVISFTSAIPKSGTTSVLLNLALTLARESQRVLVIDASIERPAIASTLGIASEPGLTDVLSNQVPLAWSFHPTGIDRLTALPYGKANLDSVDALESLIDPLRRRYDWVLIDGNANVASDGIYMIVRQADLNSTEVADRHEAIVSAGGMLRGYVLTG